MVWCSFIKSKANIVKAFFVSKAKAGKHSGEGIMRFWCHNGKAENNNAIFKKILKEEGITYEPSAPYTQNQNGISERINRTITEKAKSILLETGLPERFWA